MSTVSCRLDHPPPISKKVRDQRISLLDVYRSGRETYEVPWEVRQLTIPFPES